MLIVSLPSLHRRLRPCHFPFLFLYLFSQLHVAHANTSVVAIPIPVAKYVFRPWLTAPRSWTLYNPANLTAPDSTFEPTGSLDRAFSHALYAANLIYTFKAPVHGPYVLRIGSIEKAPCHTSGVRIFQYSVNGVHSPKVNIKEEVGCGKPYFTDVPIRVSGSHRVKLHISQIRKSRRPSLSNLQLFHARDLPSDSTPLGSKLIEKNVGTDTYIRGTKIITLDGSLSTKRVPSIPYRVFKTARQGSKFKLSFSLPPGSYDVTLGFVEYSECSRGARVFDVHINGLSRLKSYDVYAAAGGCKEAVAETFVNQIVDQIRHLPIELQFRAIAGQAILSYVRIVPSDSPCDPVTSNPNPNTNFNHFAHSVPGIYPPGKDASFVDRHNRSSVKVRIDGSDSHTHFSYDDKTGRIISYLWTLSETGKVINRNAWFDRIFSLGTTRLKLTVTDNACMVAEAETTVSVTGNQQPGAYCYFYESVAPMPGPGTLGKGARPDVASVMRKMPMKFSWLRFRRTQFVARCIFSVEISKPSASMIISVSTGGSGIARVYEGEDLIVDSETKSESGPIASAVGLSAFEVIYQHTVRSKIPSLVFKMNGKIPKKVSHDQSMVMPVVTGISPESGRMAGGATVRISGYGLYLPMKVFFGDVPVTARRQGTNSEEVRATCPHAPKRMSVGVTVRSSRGKESNAVKYTYSDKCDDINFETHKIKSKSGKLYIPTQPTAVSIWQDGNLYIGTERGDVLVLNYNSDTLVLNSICHSEQMRDARYKNRKGKPSKRSILGITFDPRDKQPRPYLSVGTMKWGKISEIERSNKLAWSNGAIERLKPSTKETLSKDSKQCLQHDATIVRNLPVSDGDHSVNELLFTQNGDLLISVGGLTNMGLPQLDISGHWESYFSGAVLLAELSKGASFVGTIPYTTPENLRTAAPKHGYKDVRLYATGLRNMFSMSMARNGEIYGVDMGSNPCYGDASSSCDEYNEKDAALLLPTEQSAFPGNKIVDSRENCPYSARRQDKVLNIKEGRFYGHPNLQRSLLTKSEDECAWIDPDNGKSISRSGTKPPKTYEAPLAMVTSPGTGVREYGGNHFCGSMRGDLIVSQMKGKFTWHLKMSKNGDLEKSALKIKSSGGLRVEENAHGDLIFPQYYTTVSRGLNVMRPMVHSKEGLFVANALPFRHGKTGGTKVIIGGWGFSKDTSVMIGGKICATSQRSDREIVCTVPRFEQGSNPADIVVEAGGLRTKLSRSILYMAV